MIVGKSGAKIHCFGEKFIKNKKSLKSCLEENII